MVLSDWKLSPKYNKKVYSIYKNQLPQYSLFDDNFYLVVGLEGNSDDGAPYVSVVKNGESKSRMFKSYFLARKWALDFMQNN